MRLKPGKSVLVSVRAAPFTVGADKFKHGKWSQTLKVALNP
jgi:hypothetical protein